MIVYCTVLTATMGPPKYPERLRIVDDPQWPEPVIDDTNVVNVDSAVRGAP